MINKRCVVYPKDVQRITGRSERYGRKLLQEIRTELGKKNSHYITVEEFSYYTGIDLTVISQYIS